MFPDWKALCHYRSPVVSTPEQLHDLRGLRGGWDRPLDQVKLRVFLRERFNFTTREFIKHITPVLLARTLARATPQQRAENVAFGIQLKRTITKKASKEGQDPPPPKPERKITLSPLPVLEIDLSQMPPEEDWSKFAAKDGTPYDPLSNIECEILECFLQHGLPADSLEQAPRKPAKRKLDDATDSTPPAKKTKQAAAPSETPAEMIHVSEKSDSIPKKRGRPTKHSNAMAETKALTNKKGKGKSPKGSLVPPSPPVRAVFQLPTSLSRFDSGVVDLLDSDSDSDHNGGLFVSQTMAPAAKRPTTTASASYTRGEAIAATTPATRATTPGPTTVQCNPGEAFPVEALRALRADTQLLKKPTTQPRTVQSGAPTVVQASATCRGLLEVIDLT